MRKSIIGPVLALAFAAAFSSAALAQQANTEKAKAPAPAHDPKDLTGVWIAGGGGGGGGRQTDLAPAQYRTEWMKAPMPLSPAGIVAINSHHGGKGPRGIAPSKGNDPIGDANPPGLVRTLVYNRPMQFIMLPDMVVNMFEWGHFWRQIHTDSRKLPTDPDLLWYGVSVGHWDSDTFVVDTVGLEDRNWLDEWGAPESDVAKVQERWHRLDRDNMDLTITIDDAKYYTKPWTSDVRHFRLPPKSDLDSTLEEVIFSPWDEQDFNKRIRDPNPIVTTGYQGNPTQR